MNGLNAGWRIGIIAAMYVELRGLQKLMTNTAQEVVGGITFTVGKLHGCEVVAAVSGVGKVAAAACAQAMILRYRPDAVINTGVAGTLSADLDLLDIAIAESVCQHDMDTSALGDPIGMVSGFNQVYFDADLQLCRDLARCAAENGIHSKTGVIASGDQFLHTTGRKMWIRRHFGAIAAEMEGAAIGQVCTMSGVPFAVIRAISDGDGAAVDYTTFSEKAAEVSACVVSKLLSELA